MGKGQRLRVERQERDARRDALVLGVERPDALFFFADVDADDRGSPAGELDGEQALSGADVEDRSLERFETIDGVGDGRGAIVAEGSGDLDALQIPFSRLLARVGH